MVYSRNEKVKKTSKDTGKEGEGKQELSKSQETDSKGVGIHQEQEKRYSKQGNRLFKEISVYSGAER